MDRPRLLDLFCGGGGAGMGYHRAGFDVTGVDNQPQPHYPFPFIQGDALEYVRAHGHEYDAIHASPMCHRYTTLRSLHPDRSYPDQIPAVRAALQEQETPWIIENVPGAPLIQPVMLCGRMFGLPIVRHRLFESPTPLKAPAHPPHGAVLPYRPHRGHVPGSKGAWRDAAGLEWMSLTESGNAVPPAYTEWLGRQLALYMEEAA